MAHISERTHYITHIMDRPIVIKFEKLNCNSKCCGRFIKAADSVDGPSKLKRLFCCCYTPIERSDTTLESSKHKKI